MPRWLRRHSTDTGCRLRRRYDAPLQASRRRHAAPQHNAKERARRRDISTPPVTAILRKDIRQIRVSAAFMICCSAQSRDELRLLYRCQPPTSKRADTAARKPEKRQKRRIRYGLLASRTLVDVMRLERSQESFDIDDGGTPARKHNAADGTRCARMREARRQTERGRYNFANSSSSPIEPPRAAHAKDMMG